MKSYFLPMVLTVLAICSPAAAVPVDYTLSGSYSGVLKSYAGGEDYYFDTDITGTANWRPDAICLAVPGGCVPVYDVLEVGVAFQGDVLNANQEVVGSISGRFAEVYERVQHVQLDNTKGEQEAYLYSYSESGYAQGEIDFRFTVPAANLAFTSDRYTNYATAEGDLTDAVVCSMLDPVCSYLVSNGHLAADLVFGAIGPVANGSQLQLWNSSWGGGGQDYRLRDGHLEAEAAAVPEPGSLSLLLAAVASLLVRQRRS